jgi:hypothetical protein
VSIEFALAGIGAVYLLTVIGLLYIMCRMGDEHSRDVALLVRALEAQSDRAQDERRQLADRIQQPEVLPRPAIDPNPEPAPEPPEPDLALVGTVVPDHPPEPGDSQ